MVEACNELGFYTLAGAPESPRALVRAGQRQAAVRAADRALELLRSSLPDGNPLLQRAAELRASLDA